MASTITGSMVVSEEEGSIGSEGTPTELGSNGSGGSPIGDGAEDNVGITCSRSEEGNTRPQGNEEGIFQESHPP